MSEHTAEVVWERGARPFGVDYDRTHTWSFDGGVVVPASSAPGLSGDPMLVDPEEAFVASISSCHMLWFLFLAARAGLVADEYVDRPVGTMRRDDTGVTWITDVVLRPSITWADPAPDAATVEAFHDDAHRRCFIANSVRSTITVEPG